MTMKALIIAAGNGSRLQSHSHGTHKSLLPVLGLPIIDRIILSAKQTGITEFVIVTGYQGDSIKAHLGTGNKYGVSISYVENKSWKKANGISALKAHRHFSTHFVLLMADHIFDPRTLTRIQRLHLKPDESALAIDRNLDSVNDITDTTKVMVKNGRVVSLNKKLTDYNGFDTGMFVCSPTVFRALRQSTSRNHNSLSDGMRILVSEVKLRALDIQDSFWADCDTYDDIKFAQKKLVKSLTKPHDGFVSKHFNRPISGFITSRLLIYTPITPNMITLVNPVLSLVIYHLLSDGNPLWLIPAGILIQFVSIIDGCDGELARLRFTNSKFGGFFDAVVDKYVDTIVIAGLAVSYFNTTHNPIIIPISLILILSLILDGYMPNKYHILTGKKLPSVGHFFKRDIRLFILALGAVSNQIFPSLVLLLILLTYAVIARLAVAKKLSLQI